MRSFLKRLFGQPADVPVNTFTIDLKEYAKRPTTLSVLILWTVRAPCASTVLPRRMP